MKRLLFSWFVLVSPFACGPSTLDALPEVIVVVDTDLPVPRAAARLRIDLYDEGGRWFDTRDVSRPGPADWPASFSVYSDVEQAKIVFVRMRVYPEGATRDYRGERFADWGGSLVATKGEETPRLTIAGEDQTPAFEPAPLVTVDRVVAIRLEPAVRATAHVLLRGACVGTMAALGTASDQGIAVDGLASCVATEKVREPVITGPVDGPRSGTFGGEGTCSGADNQAADAVRDARICVPSGALVLGDRRLLVTPSIASTPERTFHLSRFAIDAHEASVARFRAALARGFVPPSMPLSLEGTIGTSATDTCSWSKEPRDREGLAITCLTWATARAYCKFQGGDLTSEAQWEYVATIGKGAFKTDYPWGDEPPSCDRAVYERLSGHYEQCLASGAGPRPVDSLTNDVNPLGVMGLAGNVSEWVRDSFEEYGSACWSNAPVTDPVCEGRPGFRVLRGGSWASPPLYTRAAIRQGHEDYGTLSFEGVRCAYPMP